MMGMETGRRQGGKGLMIRISTSSAGRRCCAAQDFRAERQLCPARKVKIFVMRPAEKGFAEII
jgi:hypothetical protein